MVTKINHHQIRNLKIRWIESFTIKKSNLKINNGIFCHFSFFLPFHIEISKFHMDFLINHMYNDIYGVSYQHFFTKITKDNYKIYNLIIIIIVKNSTSVECELFKMSKMSHLIMFLLKLFCYCSNSIIF